jgi:glycine cleavage system aminomethyltransferase T
LVGGVELGEVKFGGSVFVDVDGAKCHVARGGYTGEDGFEVGSHTFTRFKADGIGKC